MEIIDVSVPVQPGMIVYPGEPEVRLERVSSIAGGDVANSRLDLGVHTGTHVDAPLHFLDGASTVRPAPSRSRSTCWSAVASSSTAST